MKFFKVFILFLSLSPLLTVNAQDFKPAHPLVVGIAGNAPFIADTTLQTGISFEIWNELAQSMDIPYRPVYFEDIPHALAALQAGKVNAVAGPVSITAERAEKFRFTQPYFQSSLPIMSVQDDMKIWSRIQPFFSKKFFLALSIFLFILAIIGSILWITERKANPKQFPKSPARGIANGMWCAIATMTTTGYGDVTPRTFWGRFTASAWMIISLIFATSMIAGISSTLTLSIIQTSAIKTAEDMSGKMIAVVKSSPAADFVLDNNGKAVNMENLDEGVQLLRDKKVQGIVFDRPQLLYFTKTHPEMHLYISKAEYNKLGYGFAFPLKQADLHSLNIVLLQMQESGDIATIVRRWLGREGL